MRDMSQLTPTRNDEDIARRTPEELGIRDEVSASRDRSIERWRLLWDERRFLGKVTGIGIMLGVLVAILIPNHYASTVQLMPPESEGSAMGMMAAMMTGGGSGAGKSGGSSGGGGGGGGGGGLGAIAGDLLGLKNVGAEYVGVLKSHTIQERLVDRFDLQKVYGDKYREDACKDLSDNSAISEDRKSGIITIEVTDKNRKRAAAIGQGYVDELNRLMAEVNNSEAHRQRVFLEGRLRAVKQQLDAASLAFSQFASKNTAIDIEEQGKAMVEAAASVQGQLIGMESDLKGLQQIYTDNNPRVQSSKSSIAELRAQLEKLGGGQPGKSLQTGEIYPSIRQLPVLGVTYYDLYRNVKVQEAVFETLTAQYEMEKVEEVKDTPSVKVLDPAELPEKKSFPPRSIVASLFALVTLAGAIYWVFLQKRWRRADPNDPGKVLALEVFRSVNAKMPWSPPNGSRLHAMTHKAWIRLARRSPREGPDGTADEAEES
jgi:capsule polysaccharide export protein KpsE/RkpR